MVLYLNIAVAGTMYAELKVMLIAVISLPILHHSADFIFTACGVIESVLVNLT